MTLYEYVTGIATSGEGEQTELTVHNRSWMLWVVSANTAMLANPFHILWVVDVRWFAHWLTFVWVFIDAPIFYYCCYRIYFWVSREVINLTQGLYILVWGLFFLQGTNCILYCICVSNEDEWDLWFGTRLSIPFMYAPFAVRGVLACIISVTWMTQANWIYGLFAKLFEDKQRINDGAFLASLVTAKSPEEILKAGEQRLRRVPWENLSLEVLLSNKGTPEEVERLSEACQVGDIDFFISHSWSDDPAQKYAVLKELAEDFYKKCKRYPFFWLDKLCINQLSISEDLECLPVFVMACKKMLILGGLTYSTRLWCVWEMYVLFSMNDDVQKLQMLTVGDTPAREQLQNFSLASAHCWSAEDEAMLRSVIGDSGVEGFEDTIHQIALKLPPEETAEEKLTWGQILASPMAIKTLIDTTMLRFVTRDYRHIDALDPSVKTEITRAKSRLSESLSGKA